MPSIYRRFLSTIFINTSLPPQPKFNPLQKDKIEATRACLQLLQNDPSQKFARIMIHSYNFTVTDRDLITTHRLKNVKPGDLLQFEKIRQVGSANYTLMGQPFVDPRFVTVQACVVENGRGRRIMMEKKRQRKGIHRHKYSNPLTTVLLIQKVALNPQFN